MKDQFSFYGIAASDKRNLYKGNFNVFWRFIRRFI
nr:hypothetical protein [Enterococcus cecorum]